MQSWQWLLRAFIDLKTIIWADAFTTKGESGKSAFIFTGKAPPQVTDQISLTFILDFWHVLTTLEEFILRAKRESRNRKNYITRNIHFYTFLSINAFLFNFS